MNICETQILMFHTLFQKFDLGNKGYLVENELRDLLIEFDIDGSFAPLMLRLLSCLEYNGEQKDNSEIKKITFDNFLAFFRILVSGDKKNFMNLIFSAVDHDKNGKIGVEELIDFSTLIGDSLTEQEAKVILRECSKTNKLQQVMNNTKKKNNHITNSSKNQKQELTTKDKNFPYSSSTYSLSGDGNHILERSKSHRNFQEESKNFVFNDVSFEQLWKCYSYADFYE